MEIFLLSQQKWINKSLLHMKLTHYLCCPNLIGHPTAVLSHVHVYSITEYASKARMNGFRPRSCTAMLYWDNLG